MPGSSAAPVYEAVGLPLRAGCVALQRPRTLLFAAPSGLRGAPFLGTVSSPPSRIPSAGAASRAMLVKAANCMTRVQLAALAALPHSVTGRAT
jgi:hypothetical protein